MNNITDYLKNYLPMLLGPVPGRKQLLSLGPLPVSKKISAAVHRSLTFEYASKPINIFCSIWETELEFVYSDYDPALSQVTFFPDGDIHIFWIDWRIQQKKFNPQQAADWWQGRVDAIRKKSLKPILINNWPSNGNFLKKPTERDLDPKKWFEEFNRILSDKIFNITDVYLIDLNEIQTRIGNVFFDSRNDELSGYPFSDMATIMISRQLGCHLLPSIFGQRIKAIVLDLDNTLYSGILGEDGIDGLILTEAHKFFQAALLTLKKNGIMLAICSKNILSDVKEMFSKRKDFPLRFEDFAAVSVNWDSKSKNILEITAQLNIDTSAIIFIDDNPAEIVEVFSSIPSLKFLMAATDASLTEEYLSNYPGLYHYKMDNLGEWRTKDVQANYSRNVLKIHAQSDVEYLISLKMSVRLFLNYRPHTDRLCEMSNKFNQFNLSLLKMNESESRRAMDNEHVTLTVGLSDVFADSGIVGAFVCMVNGTKAELTEVLFSCRVLGRDIESVVFGFFLEKLECAGVETLDIIVNEGLKNAPARSWLKQYIDVSPHQLSVSVLIEKVKKIVKNHPATIEEVL